MSKGEPIRDIFNNPEAANFIYRPPWTGKHDAQKATLGVKFAQNIYFLDPWGFLLIGKTKWQRIIFRLQHPIAYTKRGFWRIYRYMRKLFIKEEKHD